MKSIIISLCICTMLTLGLSSCGNRLAKVPPNTFITKELKPMDKPFTGIWRINDAPTLKPKTEHVEIYLSTTMVVDPLLSSASATTNTVSREFAEANVKESHELAKQLDANLKTELLKLTASDIQIVSKPTKNSMTLQVAIIDLGSTKVAANVAGTIGGIWIPGLSLLTGAASKTNLVLGVKITYQGKVVCELVDYLTPPKALLGSGNDFLRFGAHRTMIERWSVTLAEQISHKGDGTFISRPRAVRLVELPNF